MPTESEIRDAVLEALHLLVQECPDDLDDSVSPIRELGLTSKDGAEFALELEDRLGCHIDNILNPLVDDERRRSRKIGEIVSWLKGLTND